MPQTLPTAGVLTYQAEGTSNASSPYFSKSLHTSCDPNSKPTLCIGRGYNLSTRTKQQIHKDLTAAGLSSSDAELLSQAAGLSQDKANAFLQNNKKKVLLTDEQQLKLFNGMRTELESELKVLLDSQPGKNFDLKSLSRPYLDFLVDLMHNGDLHNPQLLNKTVQVLSEAVSSNRPQVFNKFIQDTKFWLETAKTSPERQRRRSAYAADTWKSGSSATANQPMIGGINLEFTPEKLLTEPSLFAFDGIHLDFSQSGGAYLLQSDRCRGGRGKEGKVNLLTQGITLSDLAVCLKVLYDPAIKSKSISFSLDPYDPKKPDGPWMRKVFYPDEVEKRSIVAGTQLGEDLFEADFLLKQMSLGVKVDSLEPLKTVDFPYHQALTKAGLKPSHNMSSKPGSSTGTWSRKWIVIKGFEKDQSSGGGAVGDAMVIRDLRMGVEARQMQIGSDGKLADKVVQDPSNGSYQFAKKLSEMYDTAAAIYPVFERVRQIGKAMGIAYWMFRRHVSIEMDLVDQLIERSKVKNFTDKCPALHKSESHTIEEVRKVPVDLKAIAKTELQKRGMKNPTEKAITDAVAQIKKSNPNHDFCEKHVKKTTVNRFVFGGVQLSMKEFEDPEPKIDVKVSKAEKASFEQIVNKSERVPFPLFSQEVCTTCADYVRPLETRFPVKGAYFCRFHHPHSCQGCYNVISGAYVPLDGKKFHESCLFCTHCDEPIDKDPLSAKEGFLHEKCKDKFVQKKQEEAKVEVEAKQTNELEKYAKDNNLQFAKPTKWNCPKCKHANHNNYPVCGKCFQLNEDLLALTVQHQNHSSGNDSQSTMSSLSQTSKTSATKATASKPNVAATKATTSRLSGATSPSSKSSGMNAASKRTATGPSTTKTTSGTTRFKK